MASVLRGASDIVVCSEFVAEVFHREMPDLQCRILEHGVDILRFRRSVRDPKRPIVFGFVGTLSQIKGVEVLVSAFTRANHKDARLELVGLAYDEEFLAKVRKSVGSGVKLVGPVDYLRIPDKLAEFDVLCLPSLVPETYSLSLHEALAVGLPALVSDIGLPGRLVDRVGCGRTVSVGDIVAWSAAIRDVAEDPLDCGFCERKIPAQPRIEEESFFYEQIYWRAKAKGRSQRSTVGGS